MYMVIMCNDDFIWTFMWEYEIISLPVCLITFITPKFNQFSFRCK